LAVASGLTVIITVLVTGAHGPDVVSVRVTVPLVMLGAYVEVSELVLENVPLAALQVEPVALPPMLPARVTLPPAHTVCGVPALAVANGLTVIITVLVTGAHGPEVVRVSVTVPLVMDGEYVEVSELVLEKVPLDALQVDVVALPPMLPARVTVPPAHMVCGAPAPAVASGLTVITTVLVTDGHGPPVVSVRVTVPLVIDGV